MVLTQNPVAANSANSTNHSCCDSTHSSPPKSRRPSPLRSRRFSFSFSTFSFHSVALSFRAELRLSERVCLVGWTTTASLYFTRALHNSLNHQANRRRVRARPPSHRVARRSPPPPPAVPSASTQTPIELQVDIDLRDTQTNTRKSGRQPDYRQCGTRSFVCWFIFVLSVAEQGTKR